MVYKEHLIELWVNGKKVELESQKSLNLRFQNVLFNPEKITSSQAEYSFEFEIPSTPNNDKIFDYANNLGKLNKFHRRWTAEVYADGTIIFEGSLTLNSYKNKTYRVNLVSIKNYGLDDIFGDDVMYDISGTRDSENWYIDFNGVSTINAYNANGSKEVMFPLVSYGVFQKAKDEENSDSVMNSYTSKFDIDKYNRWWVESFYPALSLVETMRKCFEYKGYSVGGDFFNDEYLKDVYMSVNLADGQAPEYNLANPRFGMLNLRIEWQNPMDVPPSGFLDSGTTYGTVQSLNYPYLKSGNDYADLSSGEAITISPDFNLSNIRVYDMMSSDDGGSVTVQAGPLLEPCSYMYEPNEHLIVIPSDGWYKIEMIVNTFLDTTTPITASQWVHSWDSHTSSMSHSVEEKDITFNPDYRITTPLEIQLVRNYDEDIELIKGKNNFRCHDGYPDNETEMNHGLYTNYSNWVTCFPHEKLGTFQVNPTDGSRFDNRTIHDKYTYVYGDGELMAYDSFVNPNFICGLTTMGNKEGGGCCAVIKNGYSWNKEHSDVHEAMYTQDGYYESLYNIVWNKSSHNKNTYLNSPTPYYTQGEGYSNGRITCMVHLNKNDVLQLFGIHRDYTTTGGTSVSYQTSASVSLRIQAASPNQYTDLLQRNYGYDSPSEFDYKLRLSNFLNKEKRVSEWVENVADAFNLDIIQNGGNITINTKKKYDRKQNYAVDIDNRVNSDEAEASMINYPKSMAVKYKIDTDEWGAENSVLEQEDGNAKMNESDWKKYIDSGFTVINLNDDSYVTATSDKNLQFSYTWYDNFTWHEVDSSGVEIPDSEMTLRIPVISKYTYMIDGYDYEESMKHDGYGLAQRFFFKPSPKESYVWTQTYPKEKVYIYTPSNVSEDGYLNLSYKVNENSILKKYFNISAYLSSNYVEVDVYLTPEEYKSIKNGCMVHFDSDLYYPVEVEGYDPSGYNPTTLKLMKKVV